MRLWFDHAQARGPAAQTGVQVRLLEQKTFDPYGPTVLVVFGLWRHVIELSIRAHAGPEPSSATAYSATRSHPFPPFSGDRTEGSKFWDAAEPAHDGTDLAIYDGRRKRWQGSYMV